MGKHKNIIYSLTNSGRDVLLKFLNDNLTCFEEESFNFTCEVLCQKNLLDFKFVEEKYVGLDKFGEKYLKEELPEFQVLLKIKDSPLTLENLSLPQEVVSSALRELKISGFANLEKNDKGVLISICDKGEEFVKNYSNPLKEFSIAVLEKELSSKQKSILEDFKPRKRFFKKFIKKNKTFFLTDFGREVASDLRENFKDLQLLELVTPQFLKLGDVNGKKFRHYDVCLSTKVLNFGREHPLFESINFLEEVFVEMGFEEMEGPLIESAFWNMDVLWIPQDHPARDEQDTFYLDGVSEVPQDLLERVKDTHEKGIYKSHTKVGEFSSQISSKRLLRTHSTPTTFRYLKVLGERLKKGEDVNGKYFYLAKVFRNESVDATHLAEFFQGEGFIIGDDLSLSDLMGFVTLYCRNLGIEKIRFKPTFNPYTEPSMEAHYFDENLGKWYSLINSGIFRDETLVPLGLGGKTILAWGFGASRICGLLTKVKDMRELTGTTCNFDWLLTREVVRREI